MTNQLGHYDPRMRTRHIHDEQHASKRRDLSNAVRFRPNFHRILSNCTTASRKRYFLSRYAFVNTTAKVISLPGYDSIRTQRRVNFYVIHADSVEVDVTTLQRSQYCCPTRPSRRPIHFWTRNSNFWQDLIVALLQKPFSSSHHYFWNC